MDTQVINSETIIAYFLCPRKAHLLLEGNAPQKTHELMSILKQRCTSNRIRHGVPVSSQPKIISSAKDLAPIHQLIKGVLVKTEEYETECDILYRKNSKDKQNFYEPALIIATHKVGKEDILRLSLAGYLLGLIQNHLPTTGSIIDASGKYHEMKLNKYYDEIKYVVADLRKWLGSPSREVARVALNDHCPMCCYESFCVPIAEARNDITLLDRINPRLARKYNLKGIFTIEQLSFLFRPRRKRKSNSKRTQLYKPELQALAIRNNKIYVDVIPNIIRSEVEFFLDLEGVPDEDSYYLIGLLTVTQESEVHWSHWADTQADEERGWYELMQILSRSPDAPIYHYGSFESRYFHKMQRRYPVIEQVGDRLQNLNEYIHGKIYFPTRSNRLKNIAALLGANGSTPIPSGLHSIAWRYRWEDLGHEIYKNQLLTYNYEDCVATKILLVELTRIAQSADKSSDIDFPDKPNQQATTTGVELHSEFERIMRSAHAEYEQAKIKPFDAEGKRKKRKQGGQLGHPGKTRKVSRPQKIVHVAIRKECPKCPDSPLRQTKAIINQNVVDLELTKLGWKKLITRYKSYYAYCPKCTRQYGPPDLSTVGRPETLGAGLRVWVIYHRVVLRLSFPSIIQYPFRAGS